MQRGEDNLVQMFTIGDTHLYGPNVVNAFRMTVNRSAAWRAREHPIFSACDVGIKIYCGMYKVPYLILSVTGGGNMAVGNGANGTSATIPRDDILRFRMMSA